MSNECRINTQIYVLRTILSAAWEERAAKIADARRRKLFEYILSNAKNARFVA